MVAPKTSPTVGTEDGLIDTAPTSKPSNSSQSIPPLTPPAVVPLQEEPQLPISASIYYGSAGPKRCRGRLLQKLTIPRPVSQWRAGACVDLPAQAQCGVFVAGKKDNCEAQLFNMPNCFNTTQSYINTVVFTPEEQAISSMWRSMFVRCGIDVPEVGQLDPGILGAALRKPGSR
jgi:hypothetical protein